MAYHEKTTSHDIARLMVSLLLLVVAVGSLSYLTLRFGVNPLNKKHTITLAELIGPLVKKPTPVVEKGSVAGAETHREQPRFSVEAVPLDQTRKGESALEFARAQNVGLLRYKNVVYGSQVGYVPQPVDLPDAEFYPWQLLVSAPNSTLASFFSSQDTLHIGFVVQADNHYDVYVYNTSGQQNPLRKVNTFTEKIGTSSVPKVTDVSPDGRYMTLSLFTCGTCLADTPSTLVVDSVGGAYQNLGKTSLVTWGTGGEYQYKEQKEVDCPDKTSQSKCVLDPQYLEFKTGKL